METIAGVRIAATPQPEAGRAVRQTQACRNISGMQKED
jgi:hypothetical protein